MTPSEKAQELIEKFRIHTIDWPNQFVHAKQCALVAVDQVLESIPPLITLEGFGSALFENDDRIWWQKVKSELEKL